MGRIEYTRGMNRVYYDSSKFYLTIEVESGKIMAVIALQKPVRPATGGEPAGTPSFFALR